MNTALFFLKLSITGKIVPSVSNGLGLLVYTLVFVHFPALPGLTLPFG